MTKTFIEAVLAGETKEPRADIHDWVDRWHEETLTDDSPSLIEFLGLTRDEYDRWVTDPYSLVTTIERRRTAVPMLGELFQAIEAYADARVEIALDIDNGESDVDLAPAKEAHAKLTATIEKVLKEPPPIQHDGGTVESLDLNKREGVEIWSTVEPCWTKMKYAGRDKIDGERYYFTDEEREVVIIDGARWARRSQP